MIDNIVINLWHKVEFGSIETDEPCIDKEFLTINVENVEQIILIRESIRNRQDFKKEEALQEVLCKRVLKLFF